MFADGSHGVCGTAGYAVAWQPFVPGSVTKRQLLVLGFHMKTARDNNEAESAAVAESLRRAKTELVLVIRSLLAANPGPSTLETILKNPVTINVFSDNTPTMDFLLHSRWQKVLAFRKAILQRCVDESHDLVHIPAFPGLVVNIKLSWVPAHRSDFFVRLHELADRAAAVARLSGQCFRLIGEENDFSKKVPISSQSSVLCSLRFQDIKQMSPPPSMSRKRGAAADDDQDPGSKQPNKKRKGPPRSASTTPARPSTRPGSTPTPRPWHRGGTTTPRQSTQERNTPTRPWTRANTTPARPRTWADTPPALTLAPPGTLPARSSTWAQAHATPSRPSSGAQTRPSSEDLMRRYAAQELQRMRYQVRESAGGGAATGASTSLVQDGPVTEHDRHSRALAQAVSDPAMQRGAAFISDGTSSMVYFTMRGLRTYGLRLPPANWDGEGRGV